MRRCELRGTPVCVTRPAISDVTRRGLLKGAAAVSLGWGLAGCGNGNGSTATPAGNIRTIEHKYGSTRISGMPERVVTVGLTEQDYVLALGIIPVGTREWFGEYPGAVWPWAQDELGDGSLPAVLPVSELNFEQITALEPDVVLGVNSGLTKPEYDILSQIAPTVAQPSEYAAYGAPWQTITEVVGRALGRQQQASTLMPDIENQFDQVRAANPQFDGKTGLLAAIVDGGDFYIYAEGPAPRFLTSLGLALPPAAAGLFTGADRAPVQISQERLAVLEADVLVLGLYGASKEDVAGNPVYQGLDVARQGRDILLPERSLVNGALSFGSVLSLPVALDEMAPRLAAAVDGRPDTAVSPVS